ncbi:MAG: hypothetical protein VCD00_05450 [Candidatus Hydrogenedentota bacterium]
MQYTKEFRLGYRDEATGELTHHIWISVVDAENGPYFVQWMAFQNREQFLELMGIVRSLGDQVRKVTLTEPPHIQMQDLLREPMQNRMTTKGSKFETSSRSLAWWQNRMNDIDGCLEQTHLERDTIQFNLQLNDPIEEYLNSDESWGGVGGEYTVTLGPESNASAGYDAALPALTTTVNAFTRFWMGNVTALGLTYTDSFDAPETLIRDHDRVMRLPKPGRDWDF